MKKDLLTEEDLLSEIRLNGVKEISEVEEACMEPDGRISVITYGRNGNKSSGGIEKN